MIKCIIHLLHTTISNYIFFFRKIKVQWYWSGERMRERVSEWVYGWMATDIKIMNSIGTSLNCKERNWRIFAVKLYFIYSLVKKNEFFSCYWLCSINCVIFSLFFVALVLIFFCLFVNTRNGSFNRSYSILLVSFHVQFVSSMDIIIVITFIIQ